MKKIAPRTHGVLDYITVLFLWLSSEVFGMQDFASTFTLVLGVVHLVLTASTDFDAGFFKVIPFRVHGLIEILVAIALFGVAFFFRASGDYVAFYFYVGFSVILFFVWLLSDYKAVSRPEINDDVSN